MSDDDYLDDTRCANCTKDEVDHIADPDFVLKVAPCGHKLCGACELRLLQRQSSVRCPNPKCTRFIARTALSSKSLDEQEFEKDVAVRKNINTIFTKSWDDFKPSVQAYNDYLEMKEQIIYSLVTGTDEAATRDRIKAYERENKDVIKKHLNDKAERDRKTLEMLEQKKADKLRKLDAAARADMQQKRKRVRSGLEALDGAFSGRDVVVPREPMARVPLPQPVPSATPSTAGRGASAADGAPPPPHVKLSGAGARRQRRAGGLNDGRLYLMERFEAVLTLHVAPPLNST